MKKLLAIVVLLAVGCSPSLPPWAQGLESLEMGPTELITRVSHSQVSLEYVGCEWVEDGKFLRLEFAYELLTYQKANMYARQPEPVGPEALGIMMLSLDSQGKGVILRFTRVEDSKKAPQVYNALPPVGKTIPAYLWLTKQRLEVASQMDTHRMTFVVTDARGQQVLHRHQPE